MIDTSKWNVRIGWLLLPIAFVVYVNSFSGFPAIEREHSILGDGDCANYARMIEHFSPSESYGDPYNTRSRGVGDIAQKHKIHHFFYVVVASLLYDLIRGIYGVLSVSSGLALYSVNALVTCANILLLGRLLRSHNPHDNPTWPFLLLYAFSLSTWIFASVPESWPFSATLILIFFNVIDAERVSPRVAAALVGAMMLNNMILLFLVGFIALRRLAGSWKKGTVWLAAALDFLLAGLVWLTLLTILSLVEPGLRPDRYAEYTLWFRKFTLPLLPKWDPYVWQSMATNLYVNSVLSNQADPQVPQEALRYTLEGGWLGRVATAVYAALMALGAWRVFGVFRAARRDGRGILDWLAEKGQSPLVWCGLMLGINLALFYPGGFLYSTVAVPFFSLIYCRFLDLRRNLDRWLVFAAVVAVLLNNTVQVVIFREALAAL